MIYYRYSLDDLLHLNHNSKFYKSEFSVQKKKEILTDQFTKAKVYYVLVLLQILMLRNYWFPINDRFYSVYLNIKLSLYDTGTLSRVKKRFPHIFNESF